MTTASHANLMGLSEVILTLLSYLHIDWQDNAPADAHLVEFAIDRLAATRCDRHHTHL